MTPIRHSAAEDLFDSLTPAEILARAQAAAAHHDATHQKRRRQGGVTQQPQGRTKQNYFEISVRQLHAGLALADQLIRAKGGDVPLDTGRAVIADAHQRALARRKASALAETA